MLGIMPQLVVRSVAETVLITSQS